MNSKEKRCPENADGAFCTKTQEDGKVKGLFVRILCALIAIGVLAGAGVLTAVCVCAGREREAESADCIIVLGARVWPSGRMSTSLLYRCERALQAWKDGIAGSIIACGGQGDDEPAAEADVMKAYFLENGVPEGNVIAENRSVNTIENLKNAKAIMDANGWKTAAVVTNDYHVERSLWIAKDAGIDACGIAAPSSERVGTLILSRVRESLSWVLYALRKAF